MHLWSCRTKYGRVDLALVVEYLYLYARILPIRLCDNTLTLVVPSGPLMVADKHNWSREVTYGPLDCSWSHEISFRGLGRSQQSLLDCWAIAGFHGEPWAIAGLLLGTWAIVGLLLDCCLVAPFAVWSPLTQSGRPLRNLVAPFHSLVAPFAIPLPEECL